MHLCFPFFRRGILCFKHARFVATGLKACIIPTNHFQKSLPTLKVPELKSTLERYINSQEALLNANELDVTRKLASNFETSRGLGLQSALEAYAAANRNTSYITNMWSDMYLCDRRPVVLTHNPAIIFKDSQLGDAYQQPAIRAANMLYSVMRFHRLLRANELEPEVFHLNPKRSKSPLFYNMTRFTPSSMATYVAYLFKAFPLDMSQFNNMFGATRIPRPEKDELFVAESSRHFLLIREGQMYVFEVFDHHGNLISGSQLLANILFVLDQPRTTNAPGIGSITSLDRDQAVVARERLVSLGNEAVLSMIDSALLALVLDDNIYADICDLTAAFVAGPSDSRWFDKCVNVIVDGAGRTGIHFEHSWGDGVAVVRLFDEMFNDSENNPIVGPQDLINRDKLPLPTVRRLEWQLDDRFVRDILIPAREAYDQKRRSMTQRCMIKYEGLTKALCKQTGVSADAMMQLSIQMANDMVHAKPSATYESCSTSAFKHGRTETLRSATRETRHFVELMRRGSSATTAAMSVGKSARPVADPVAAEELQNALTACSVKHMKLAKEAAMGQGWDRHLFALRQFAARDLGRSLPELFQDENYEMINRIVLSTSTLPSEACVMGGFAAPEQDGYGLAYAIKDDVCGLLASTWDGAPNARAEQIADAFGESSDRIASLLRKRLSTR